MGKQVRVNHAEFVKTVRGLIDAGNPNPLQEAARQTGVHPVTAGRICREAGLSVRDAEIRKDGMLRIVRAILSAKPGQSLEDIGQSLNPPVSRQRVHQIRKDMRAAGFKENESFTMHPVS